jgi:RNA polymerase sigma factor (sigma-70 family)
MITAPDEALDRLYFEQSQSLLRLATVLVWAMVPEGVAESAEEITQEAFAGMHREWRRLQDAERARAYLRRAVVRSARLLAAAAPSPRLAGSGQEGRAPAITATSDEMLAALRVMPGFQREALVLRYYADLPEAQAADAMGITRGAFRRYVARGMTSLRTFLDEGSLSRPSRAARRGAAVTGSRGPRAERAPQPHQVPAGPRRGRPWPACPRR